MFCLYLTCAIVFQRAAVGETVPNIQLQVVLSDHSTMVSVNESDNVESVMFSALETFRAWNADCYCRVGKHVVSNESTFHDSCKLYLELRGRGGSSSGGPAGLSSGSAGLSSRTTGGRSGHPTLAQYINSLKAKENSTWFEKVALPPNLQRVENIVITETIILGDDGTDTLNKLLEFMERKHSIKRCYSANLDVHHIIYSEDDKRFEAEGIAQPVLTNAGYTNK